MRKMLEFLYSYPPNFIKKVWADNPHLADHLQSKFNGYYERKGALEGPVWFINDLDTQNSLMLSKYIDNLYKTNDFSWAKSKLGEKGDMYAKGGILNRKYSFKDLFK